MKKLFIAKAVIITIIATYFCSCVTVRENRLMGDVIGFSDDIQTSFKTIYCLLMEEVIWMRLSEIYQMDKIPLAIML